MRELNVVVLKPSKYGRSGYVERFRWGFMPNATVAYIVTLLSALAPDVTIRVHAIDEYVWTDLAYYGLFDVKKNGPTLVLLVGVQTHQLHRALDLAALAICRGCMAVIGGPHAMVCDTSVLQGKGVSFCLAEAEVVLEEILRDAVVGELKPVYGQKQRWTKELNPPVLKIPSTQEFERYVHRQLGVYPARGCSNICDFCTVTDVAGRIVRSQPINTTVATLREAQKAGIKMVFFVSDNFNKYKEARALCEAIIDAKLGLKFFVQCDVQIKPDLLEVFARAGVYQVFFGIESLNRTTLKKMHKALNRPEKYREIKQMCDEVGITPNFTLINGFPDDTYESVLDQLRAVSDIDPGLAWFFTLCPGPGSVLYDDLRRRGLITEPNLDRFDGTCSTWWHPNLTGGQLDELLWRCYREFYTLKRAAAYRPLGAQTTKAMMWAATLFMRHCAWRGMHPMSGGVWSMRVDHVNEYLQLRRKTYGLTLVPLPDRL